MRPLSFIGVPIDSVGRDGGTEHGPEALRELGLPGRSRGGGCRRPAGADPGRAARPGTGLLGSDDVLASTRTDPGGRRVDRRGVNPSSRRLLPRAAGRPRRRPRRDRHQAGTGPPRRSPRPLRRAPPPRPARPPTCRISWCSGSGRRPGSRRPGAATAPGAPRWSASPTRRSPAATGMRHRRRSTRRPLLASGAELRARATPSRPRRSPPRWPSPVRSGCTSTSTSSTRPAPCTDYLLGGGMDWTSCRRRPPLLSSKHLGRRLARLLQPRQGSHRACGVALVEVLAAAESPNERVDLRRELEVVLGEAPSEWVESETDFSSRRSRGRGGGPSTRPAPPGVDELHRGTKSRARRSSRSAFPWRLHPGSSASLRLDLGIVQSATAHMSTLGMTAREPQAAALELALSHYS